ncbi:MAG: PRC-barrel domain-containing protein [Candidatus Hydrothermarchaeota archaeon]
MWLIRLVGALDVVIGVLTFLMPMRIYNLLYLPAVLLILNGAALLYLGLEPEGKRETAMSVPRGGTARPPMPQRPATRPAAPVPPPVRVVARFGGGMGKVIPRKGQELVGKEVYDQTGRHHGRVESVSLDEEGNLRSFEVVKGEMEATISGRDIESSKGIVLLRYGKR